MKSTTKLDTTKIVKKASREFFMEVDTRTKSIPSKKNYKRKAKHKNRVDY